MGQVETDLEEEGIAIGQGAGLVRGLGLQLVPQGAGLGADLVVQALAEVFPAGGAALGQAPGSIGRRLVWRRCQSGQALWGAKEAWLARCRWPAVAFR